MTRIERQLASLRAALDELRVDWALVGGLAVSIRTHPRTTRDIDVVVAVSGDSEAEIVLRGLRDRGYSVLQHFEQTATGRLAMAQLAAGSGADAVPIDVLFASSGIEAEVAREAERIGTFRELDLPVARIPHLVALKTLAASPLRLQDRQDLQLLLRAASAAELDEARGLLRLIAGRGFARKKNLESELDEALAALGRSSSEL